MTSPVNGTVVRWRMLQASPPFKYKLRVLIPAGGDDVHGSRSSAAETPLGSGVETFATALPIKAGQTVGLDLEPGAPLGFVPENGGGLVSWSPALAEGATLLAIPSTLRSPSTPTCSRPRPSLR